MKEHYSNVSGGRHTSSSNKHVNNNADKKSSSTKGKTEWRKTAIRICDDWSEQLSSKNKIYYYNCRTEVSQWQKPKEWSLPDVPKQQLIDTFMKREKEGAESHAVKRTHSIANSTPSEANTRFVNRTNNTSIPSGVSPLVPLGSSVQSGTSPKRLKYSNEPNQSWPSVGSTNHRVPYPSHNTTNNVSVPYASTSHPPVTQHNSGASTLSSLHQQHLHQQSKPPFYQPFSSNHQSSSVVRTKEGGVSSQPIPTTSKPYSADNINDDMDISPNSSPMSGGSSCSPLPGGFSPRRRSSGPNVPPQYHHPGNAVVPGRQSNRPGAPPYGGQSRGQPAQVKQGVGDQQSNIRSLLDTLNTLIYTRSYTARHQQPSSTPHPSGCQPGGTYANQIRGQAPAQYSRSISTPSTSSGHQVNASFLNDITSAITTLTGTSGNGSSGYPPQSLSTRQMDELVCRLESHLPPASSPTPSPGGIVPGNRPTPYRQHTQAMGMMDAGIRRQGPGSYNSPYPGPSPIRPQHSPAPPTAISSVDPGQLADLTRQLQDILNRGVPSGQTKLLLSVLNRSLDQLRCSVSPSVYKDDRESPSQFADRNYPNRRPSPQTNGHHTNPLSNCLLPGRPGGAQHSPTAPPGQQQTSGSILDSVEVMRYLDSTSLARFRDPVGERLEQEAQMEAQKFDKLQTVLYGELSGELKKLRALVRIGEIKTTIHQMKKDSLNELMELTEARKPPSSFSSKT